MLIFIAVEWTNPGNEQKPNVRVFDTARDATAFIRQLNAEGIQTTCWEL